MKSYAPAMETMVHIANPAMRKGAESGAPIGGSDALPVVARLYQIGNASGAYERASVRPGRGRELVLKDDAVREYLRGMHDGIVWSRKATRADAYCIVPNALLEAIKSFLPVAPHPDRTQAGSSVDVTLSHDQIARLEDLVADATALGSGAVPIRQRQSD